MKRFAQHADKLIPCALALTSLALYLRTLAPDVVDADGGQFQFAAWNFGFVHPTGYPLFLILGGLFQHLVPIGNPAFRLNLFTALTAALAIAALYLAVNELTRARGAAIIAAASFALTRTFWYDASAAEVYALNACFTALLIFIALRWQADPSARTFAVFCFICGLALTHHRAIGLWVPAFALFFLVSSFKFQVQGSRFKVRGSRFQVSRFKFNFLLCAFSFLLPLALYLYVPLRAPASPYFALPFAPGRDLILYDNTLAGFINYVLGRTFQSEIGWDATSVARLLAFPQLLFDQFGVLGAPLGGAGMFVMAWRKEWARLILLAIGFSATILFASLYHIGDILHYYIPACLVWAIWIGVGIVWLWQRDTRYVIRGILSALLVAFILDQLATNFPFADRSRETQSRAQWTQILSAPIPPNAILISNDRDEMMPLWYIQYVENTRRDLLGLFPLITPAPEHANIARVTDRALGAHRPVYFVKAMPGIEIKYRVVASDALWRVTEQNRAPQQSSDAVLADRVRVFGYDVAREADALRVAVYWSPLTKLDRDYTTFVHLLDPRGNKIAQGNDHQVGGAFYPTMLWDVGETLRDEFVIALPPHLAPGTYTLVAGMYATPELEALGKPVVVGTIEMK
ncbi:MAG: DUF2723 domain-containing protein [Chloroflexi bacterium]|nr:DUF2723 domain-containing protein [Chloroflexota bacterium]